MEMLRKVTADELFGGEIKKLDQRAVSRGTHEEYLANYCG